MRASIQLIPESIQLTCLSCISERILTVDDGGSKSHEDPPIENGNKHFKKKKKAAELYRNVGNEKNLLIARQSERKRQRDREERQRNETALGVWD